MSCSDDNPYFDIGTHEEAFGVQGNSTEVLAMQIQRRYWSTLKINGFNKHRLMNIKTGDFRAREAPQFIAGSSHYHQKGDYYHNKFVFHKLFPPLWFQSVVCLYIFVFIETHRKFIETQNIQQKIG
jgi:hypothetical protein